MSTQDYLSLDESLNIALRLSPLNLEIIEIPLGQGADASSQHAVFMSAVVASNQDLVSLLISAPKVVSVQSMTDALWAAVSAGSLEMVFLLGTSDADADDGNGKCLKAAVQNNQPDIVVTLTLCKCPPTSKTLDEAMSLIFSDDSKTHTQKLKLVEILLSSGPKGNDTASTFIHVIELCTTNPALSADTALIKMLKLLFKFNASLEFKDLAALKAAMHSSRLDLIDIFLQGRQFNADLATVAFAAIDQLADRDLQLTIASRLLDKGAYGTPLHEALIYAVQTDHTAAVETLVRSVPNKTSTNYKDAAALKDAVSREKIDVVKILLSGGPNESSVTKTFPYIWNCGKEARLILTKEPLDHKAKGESVNSALVAAVTDHSLTRDERLIKLLISKGADINFANGKAIDLATKDFDIPALDTLLAGKSLYPKSLNLAFASAIALQPPTNRLKACKKLINAGAIGEEVNKALTLAVMGVANDTSLLKMLAPKANIDYNGGQAMSLAIEKSFPQHLTLLLEMGPNETTFDNAFTSAMNHSETSE